jgi:hypothetical protein
MASRDTRGLRKKITKRPTKVLENVSISELIRYPGSKPDGEFNALHANPHGS